MAKGMMEEEMAGIGMPPEEDTAEMPTEEPMAEEPEIGTSITVDSMIANYEAMDENQKTLAQVFAQPEIASYIDEILGQPLMTDFIAQANIKTGQPETEESPETGMMTPTEEPMAEMPMEDEEATPPV